MTAFERHSYSGSAPDAVLSSAIDDTALSVTCDDLTGWPDGTGGNFVVIFEPGKAAEEKCLASARSGNTLTLVSRGMEGAASAHAATTTTVRHGYSARDADEANNAVSQTIGKIAAKGDLLVGSAANTLVKLGIGSTGKALVVSGGTLAYGVPTIAESDVTDLVDDLATLQTNIDAKQDAPDTDWVKGALLVGTGAGTADTISSDTTGDVPTIQSDGTLAFQAATVGAWTAYTPTIKDSSGNGLTVGNGTLAGRYIQIGKHITVQVHWTAGSTSSTSGMTATDDARVSLPVTPSGSAVGACQSLVGQLGDSMPHTVAIKSGDSYAKIWLLNDSNGNLTGKPCPCSAVANTATGSAGMQNIAFTLTYEAA